MEIEMEHGPKYILTIHGLLKLVVIAFSCTTFALLADSNRYDSSTAMQWVLAAFIISFSISVLFCFFRVLGLSRRMSCDGPCSYDGFDFIWAWFSTVWCFSAAIVFAANYPDNGNGLVIGSIIFAWLTFIAYAVEAFFLRFYAPANIGFVATKPGWVKTALVVFGAAAFGLLVDAGYPNACWGNSSHRQSCEAGMTYALVAFTVTWSITTIMWLAHLAAPTGSIDGSENFKKAEMIWAIIGVLFFWTGASCFAAYMNCSGDEFEKDERCQKSLSGVIAGFLTGGIYLLEFFILKF